MSALLFSIGVYGVLARRNAILVLMSVELMLNAVNLNLVAFDMWLRDTLHVNDPAVGASMAYLVFYAAMNLIAFWVVMLISHQRGRDTLDDYRGLVYRHPAVGLALGFFLMCLAGLPPWLVGLFAKIVVFREVVAGRLGWLAVVMAVNTVIGLVYYIAWTARLFTPAASSTERAGPLPVAVAASIVVLATVAFSVAPQLVPSVVR